MLVMFFKVTRHSPVSWEMMEDLDGIEPYQVVMVRNIYFCLLSFYYYKESINVQ